MKPAKLVTAFLSSLLFLLTGCGESGKHTADVVQAATKGVSEAGQQLAQQAARLADLTPEVAKAKMQELVDDAAAGLRAVKDSETAQELAADVERVLDQLVELGKKLGAKLDLASVQQSVTELIERFKNDPRVVKALESVKEKLKSLTG